MISNGNGDNNGGYHISNDDDNHNDDHDIGGESNDDNSDGWRWLRTTMIAMTKTIMIMIVVGHDGDMFEIF